VAALRLAIEQRNGFAQAYAEERNLDYKADFVADADQSLSALLKGEGEK
jgi:hypothetical protein